MHKPSTVSTGREMWANFIHDKWWVWWTSTGSQNLFPKQTRSLLFTTTSWLRKVKNSKHQLSWEFNFCIEYIVAAFKAAIYEIQAFLSCISPPLEQHIHIHFFCSTRWCTACVQRNLKVILIKNHGKSLLFGYYKLGFRCLELNLFFTLLLQF